MDELHNQLHFVEMTLGLITDFSRLNIEGVHRTDDPEMYMARYRAVFQDGIEIPFGLRLIRKAPDEDFTFELWGDQVIVSPSFNYNQVMESIYSIRRADRTAEIGRIVFDYLSNNLASLQAFFRRTIPLFRQYVPAT